MQTLEYSFPSLKSIQLLVGQWKSSIKFYQKLYFSLCIKKGKNDLVLKAKKQISSSTRT